MLSGEGNENGEKTTIGLISEKATLHQGPVVQSRLALTPGLNLTRVSFSCVQKHFFG